MYPIDKLFCGFNQFGKLPLRIDITHNAYESYKIAGSHPVNDYWEVLPDGNPSLFRLPVCDSDASCADVTDFKREDKRQNKAFPVSSGTWRPEGVLDFTDFITLSNTTTLFERGALGHLYFKRIPNACFPLILGYIFFPDNACRKSGT
jgi:hypothetical protein